MTTIPASLRRLVIQRADNRCEYCGISQIGQVATFHIDHIVPVVAGGGTTAENLALACVSCSLRKGTRLEIRDLGTRNVAHQPPQIASQSQQITLIRLTGAWALLACTASLR